MYKSIVAEYGNSERPCEKEGCVRERVYVIEEGR